MDEQKRPRAWVYARIPGDYDGTMNSYKVCSMQALHDGCDIVGGSIDERGGWLLRPGYRDMMQQIKGGKVDRVYICRMRQISGKERHLYSFFKRLMKKTSLNTTKVTDHKIKRLYLVAATVVAAAFVMAMPAFADAPLTTITNLRNFVFSAIKAIGAILLGWGVVQIGLRLQSHAPSQRSTGFLTFFGGLVIAFAKEILDLILK